MNTMEAVRQYMAGDEFARRNNIELGSMSPGQATARMVVHPHHLNGYGTVMGGAIFTLADFAFAAASNAHGTVAVAINVSISFLKAVRTGVLRADAREISRNPKLATYTVEVRDDTEEIVALFQGMVYRKKDVIVAKPAA